MAISALFTVTPKFAQKISEAGSGPELLDIAIENGFADLEHDAEYKVAEKQLQSSEVQKSVVSGSTGIDPQAAKRGFYGQRFIIERRLIEARK